MDLGLPPVSLGWRIVVVLRASFFALASSLVGLALVWGAYTLTEPGSILLNDGRGAWVWAAWTLAGAAVCGRFAFPNPPGGAACAALRAVMVLLVGAGVAGAIALPAFAYVRNQALPGYFAGFGLLGIVFLALSRPPKASPEVVVVDPALVRSGLLPAPPPPDGDVTSETRYALDAKGPPVAPEESERTSPALEVSVLWGGERVRVAHVEPPRSLSLHELGSDLPLLGELAHAGDVVVVSRRGGVQVVPPPGPDAGAPEPAPVDLEVGGRATIVVVQASKDTAYRGGSDGAPAALAVEVALVRAGKVVGRGLALEGLVRPLACTAVAAGLAATLLSIGARPLTEDEREAVEREQILAMQRTLQAIDERDQGDEELDPVDLRKGAGQPRAGPLTYGHVDALPSRNPYRWGKVWETMGPPALDAFAPAWCSPWEAYRVWDHPDDCAPYEVVGQAWFHERHGWRVPPDAWAAYPVGTAKLDERPPPGGGPTVHLGSVTTEGGLPLEATRAVLAQVMSRLRVCFAQVRGLKERTPVEYRMAVDGDGLVVDALLLTSVQAPTGSAARCTMGALYRLPFPAPSSPPGLVDFKAVLEP